MAGREEGPELTLTSVTRRREEVTAVTDTVAEVLEKNVIKKKEVREKKA